MVEQGGQVTGVVGVRAVVVSIQEVAQRAGVGATTFHRHFPTKGDVVGEGAGSRRRDATTTGPTLVRDRGWPLADASAVSAMSSAPMDGPSSSTGRWVTVSRGRRRGLGPLRSRRVARR
ncbi:helix-turn-helix domain-containing protein [Embleya sp. NPDC001921]